MIKELECVVLKKDIPAYGLKAGDVGTVVLCHKKGGYEVEFMTYGGRTVAVATLEARELRPVSPKEISHVRPLQGVK